MAIGVHAAVLETEGTTRPGVGGVADADVIAQALARCQGHPNRDLLVPRCGDLWFDLDIVEVVAIAQATLQLEQLCNLIGLTLVKAEEAP